MKFAHIADVHLGYEQYHQSWRAEDFARAFKEAAIKAIKNKVDFVIISGDLFHRSVPNPKTIRDAIDILLLFKRNNIPVFAIEGNHDKSIRDFSIYHLLESLGLLNLIGLRKKRVENEFVTSVKLSEKVYLVKGVFKDLEIVGDRYRTKLQLEKVLPYLRAESDESVLVLHQSIKEVVDVEIDLAYELTLKDLPKASYYAMGHVHIPKVYEFNGSYIVYPGSPERYDLREASHKISYTSDELNIKEGIKKGFYIVKDFKPEFVEIPTRDFYSVYIEASTKSEIERKLLEILRNVSNEAILIAKVVCEMVSDVKDLIDRVSKSVKYADLRFEFKRDIKTETKFVSEKDFFNDFELELLERLKGDFDDSLIEFVRNYFMSDTESKIKKEEKIVKTVERPKKPKTLLDFIGGG